MMTDPRTTRRRVAAVLLAPLLPLALAACSSPEPAPAPAPSSVAAPTATATAAEPGRTPTGSTLPPPATTPVPQKSPGDINSVVPTEPEKTREAVPLGRVSEAEGGLRVRITKVAELNAKAQGPGEVAGPALALTVKVDNGSQKPVDLNNALVTLSGSDGAPGETISTKPAKPLTGRLKAGRSASGVYVFTVAPSNRNPITVAVTLAGGGTVLIYKGKP